MHENHRLVARVLGIASNCLGATVINPTNVTFGVLRACGLVSLGSVNLYMIVPAVRLSPNTYYVFPSVKCLAKVDGPLTNVMLPSHHCYSGLD